MLIPSELGDLTSDWLSEALRVPVTGVRVLDAHAGTTGRALLELDYGAAVDLPGRLFAKLPPADEQQRRFVTSSGMGWREACFYAQLAAELPVRVPRCHYAASDESGERYIMLLENLVDSGCTFRNARSRYSLDYVRTVLDAFASLHAAFWESPRFAADLDWLRPPLQHDIGARLVERALSQHAAAMPPVFTALGELYLAETDAIHRLWQRGAPTLIHGDVHDGNLFHDVHGPGLLDWAVIARGPALRDVGYFLAGTLTPEHQREAGHDLLDHYRQRLLALGVDAPEMGDLWRQYQWHAAYVWVGAAVTLAMGDAWQPSRYVLASLRRLHDALETLDSVAAIRDAL